MSKETNDFMLTTVDNPYNPFTQFDEWFVFDRENHYDCCNLLDRFANTNNKMDEIEIEEAIQNAFDRIIEIHGGLYIKVTKDDPRFLGDYDFSKEKELVLNS